MLPIAPRSRPVESCAGLWAFLREMPSRQRLQNNVVGVTIRFLRASAIWRFSGGLRHTLPLRAAVPIGSRGVRDNCSPQASTTAASPLAVRATWCDLVIRFNKVWS